MSGPNAPRFPMGIGAFQHVYLEAVVLCNIRLCFERERGGGGWVILVKRPIELVGTRQGR